MAKQPHTSDANDTYMDDQDWEKWGKDEDGGAADADPDVLIEDDLEDQPAPTPAPAPTPVPPTKKKIFPTPSKSAAAPEPEKKTTAPASSASSSKLFSSLKSKPAAPAAATPASAKATLTPKPKPAEPVVTFVEDVAKVSPVVDEDDEDVAHKHKKVKFTEKEQQQQPQDDFDAMEVIKTISDLSRGLDKNHQAAIENERMYISAVTTSINLLKTMVDKRTTATTTITAPVAASVVVPVVPPPTPARPVASPAAKKTAAPVEAKKTATTATNLGEMKLEDVDETELGDLFDHINAKAEAQFGGKTDLEAFVKKTGSNINTFMPNRGHLPGEKYTEEELNRYMAVIEYFQRQFPNIVTTYVKPAQGNSRVDIAFTFAKKGSLVQTGKSRMACLIARPNRDEDLLTKFVNVVAHFTAAIALRQNKKESDEEAAANA